MKPVASSLSIAVVTMVFSVTLKAQDDAAAIDDSAADAASTPGDACFSIRQAQRMRALDDRSVFLETSGNRSFLLTMSVSCPDLGDAIAIAFDRVRRDRVCSGDRVPVSYRVSAGIPLRSCPLNKVEAVASREQAEALVAERSE